MRKRVSTVTDADHAAAHRQVDGQLRKLGAWPRKRARIRFPHELPLPGWNERKMTIRDFNAACEREGIIVVRRRLGFTKGFYCRISGLPFIFIDRAIKGQERLFVSFHELGHFFMHGSEAMVAMSLRDDKTPTDWFEVEANACARIALKPGERFARISRALLRPKKGGAR